MMLIYAIYNNNNNNNNGQRAERGKMFNAFGGLVCIFFYENFQSQYVFFVFAVMYFAKYPEKHALQCSVHVYTYHSVGPKYMLMHDKEKMGHGNKTYLKFQSMKHLVQFVTRTIKIATIRYTTLREKLNQISLLIFYNTGQQKSLTGGLNILSFGTHVLRPKITIF